MSWKNYYATKFKSSRESGVYAINRFQELLEKTEQLSSTIQNSTLPDFVKDAVSANLSVLKPPTVLRLEDGSLWGLEGCSQTGGSCEGKQHHTLDMEMFGPSAWLQGFYLLALDCGAKMAEALNEEEKAKKYRHVYEKGKKWTNDNLFNGRHFCQKVDLGDKSIIDSYKDAEGYWNFEAEEIKYHVAEGCIIDQMLADLHRAILGCEDVFQKDKKQCGVLLICGATFP